MGKIIEASFKEIYPGEELFIKRTLAEVIKRVKKEPLFIIPVRLYNSKFVNLDGRHRLIYHMLSGERDIKLFFSENPDDIITNNIYQHKNWVQYLENNENIRKRWSWIERDDSHWIRPIIHYTNYKEYFRGLQKQFPYLKDMDTCLKHLIKEGYIRKNFSNQRDK